MVFGQAFWSEGSSGGGLETEASAPVSETGQSWKRAPFLLGQAFRMMIGSPFWLVVQVLGPAHELHILFATSSAGPSLCWQAGLLGTSGL